MAAKTNKSGFNLRTHYTIFMEIGLILALLIFIVAMRSDLPSTEKSVNFSNEDEVVTIKHIPQTEQHTEPAAPVDPFVPARLPNDDPVIVDPNITPLDSDPVMNNETIALPPKNNDKNEDIYMVVEHEPKLIGGLKELQQKVEYPAKCRRANIEGRVTLQFIVNKKGDVENINVLQGIGGECDKAAIEAIKKYAKFKPGLQRGAPVNVRFSLPIFFKLK